MRPVYEFEGLTGVVGAVAGLTGIALVALGGVGLFSAVGGGQVYLSLFVVAVGTVLFAGGHHVVAVDPRPLLLDGIATVWFVVTPVLLLLGGPLLVESGGLVGALFVLGPAALLAVLWRPLLTVWVALLTFPVAVLAAATRPAHPTLFRLWDKVWAAVRRPFD
ncbi:MAG: hypothetical protein ABEJ68_10495 [Halobacteriaceae archaeon]